MNLFDRAKKRYRLRVIIPAFPAFNIYSRIARGTTALGPVSVATAVHEMERWDVEVIDENNLRMHGPISEEGGVDNDFLQKLRPADVVGLYGGLTSTIPRLYKLARYYKGKGVITIAGGQHFVEDTIPEALSSGVDYVVIGEGEDTIRELLLAIEHNRDASNIKGLAYIKDGKVFYTPPREAQVDFDKLPIPDFSLVRYAKISLYPVARIRGCGMDCEFCTVKGKPRYASPERLLEQISYLVETRNARHFFIVDDLFGQQREETIKFCNMLRDYQKSIGMRLDLGAQIRLDKAKDSELLSAMRQCGINTIAIGYESPIAEELKAMNKHLNPQAMLDLTRIYHKAGFLIHGMFIFGYPMPEGVDFRMSAEERVKRFRAFISKAKIDTIQVLLPGPLAGTELRKRLEKHNRIYPIEDIGWEYYDGNFSLFEPDEPMSPEDMQAAAKKIMG
ncbi:MAG: radical SAM protein, partial [Candidatus Omnitrophota bacterium]